MIPRECKRLAEVDFPIATVSRHAAREKSVRQGILRRCICGGRAARWRHRARCCWRCCCPIPPIRHVRQRSGPARERRWEICPIWVARVARDDLNLRAAVLRFIGDCADWDRSADMAYLTAARALIHAAHGEDTPLVVDPFAGGGSIPLEALRLGCDVYASDLNPVACLILKTMLEDVPRHGPGLAEKVRAAGAEIRAAAERELGRFYPLDPDGARPIAYLWARTVRCEASDCGAEIPLARSFWLATKRNRRRALRYHVERPKDRPAIFAFQGVRTIGRKRGAEGDSKPRNGGVRLLRQAAWTRPGACTIARPARWRGRHIRQRRKTDRRRDDACDCHAEHDRDRPTLPSANNC